MSYKLKLTSEDNVARGPSTDKPGDEFHLAGRDRRYDRSLDTTKITFDSPDQTLDDQAGLASRIPGSGSRIPYENSAGESIAEDQIKTVDVEYDGQTYEDVKIVLGSHSRTIWEAADNNQHEQLTNINFTIHSVWAELTPGHWQMIGYTSTGMSIEEATKTAPGADTASGSDADNGLSVKSFEDTDSISDDESVPTSDEDEEITTYEIDKTPEPYAHGMETAEGADRSIKSGARGVEIDIIWDPENNKWVANHDLQYDLPNFPSPQLSSISQGDDLDVILDKIRELKSQGHPIDGVWLDVKTTLPTLDKFGIDMREAWDGKDFPSFMKELYSSVMNNLGEVWKGDFSSIIDGLTNSIKVIPETLDFILDVLPDTLSVITESLKGIVESVGGGIWGFFKNIGELFTPWGDEFLNPQNLIDAFNDLTSIPENIFNTVKDAVSEGVTTFAFKLQGYMHDISLSKNDTSLNELYERAIALADSGIKVYIETYSSKVIGNKFAENLHENIKIQASFGKDDADQYFGRLDYEVPQENRSYGPNNLSEIEDFNLDSNVNVWTIQRALNLEAFIEKMNDKDIENPVVLLESNLAYRGHQDMRDAPDEDTKLMKLLEVVEKDRHITLEDFDGNDRLDLKVFDLPEDAFIDGDEFSGEGDGEVRLNSEKERLEIDYDGDAHIDKKISFSDEFNMEEMTRGDLVF